MSIINGHTFGIFTQSQKGVTFTNVVAEIVDYSHENNPDHFASPNRPRKERWEGQQNPILGDEGNGKIGRWQEVKIEAVQNLLDQIIEYYLRDRQWYSTIRCREALWNMYRKMAWYVKYEIGEEVSEYRKALQLIKDCIYKIEHPETIDERKIFEELFNVEGKYSSKLTFHEAFEWGNSFDNVSEDGHDGIMQVKGQTGEFDVKLSTINMNYDGYISFQYGGRVNDPDVFEFYINDKLVWSTKNIATEGIEDKTQRVKVKAGPNDFKWVYKSNGGASDPWFWIDVIRLYEYMPVYSKYQVGYVDVMNPPDRLRGGFDYNDLTMTEGWNLVDTELDKFITDGAYDFVSKIVRIDSDEAFFQFQYSISKSLESIEGFITVMIDGVEVWWNYGETHGTEFIRIDNLPKGEYEISIVFQAVGEGEVHVIFRDFEVYETRQTEKAYKKYTEMGIPYCPPPYLLKYNGAFYVDFNGDYEYVELFNTAKEPLWEDLPGLFRYVSSSEEQEWEAVGYVEPPILEYDEEGNLIEPPPPENILKFPIGKLKHGNHTKVTTLWKFKERGSVSFDFLASTNQGNGLIFFINGRQVSQEWNRATEWNSAMFNVEPGQTYKFDWLIRRKNVVEWGHDAIFIKNIAFYEVIAPSHPFIPKTQDEQFEEKYIQFENGLITGEELYNSNTWFIDSESSVMQGAFQGDRYYIPKEHERVLCGDCNGEMQFSYTLDVETPDIEDFDMIFFSDDFVDEYKHVTGMWGKDKWSGGESDWNEVTTTRNGFTFDGMRASTIENVSYEYNLHVFNDYLLDRNRVRVQGQVSIECPPRYIHHYDPTDTTPEFYWRTDNLWRDDGSFLYVDGSFEESSGEAEASFAMNYSGTISFSLNFQLGENDKLEVMIDGSLILSKTGSINEQVSHDLSAGDHTLTFKLYASGDGEEVLVPVKEGASFYRPLNYADGTTPDNVGVKVTAPNTLVTDGKGSEVQIYRNKWWQGNGPRAFTEPDSEDYKIDFKIAPGATLSFFENVRFVTGEDIVVGLAKPFQAYNGDTCYPAATSAQNINYNIFKSSVKTKSNDILEWDDNKEGAFKGATPTYHYTNQNNITFTRKITASNLSDVNYSENVRVYNGITPKNPNTASTMSLLTGVDLQTFASMAVAYSGQQKAHRPVYFPQKYYTSKFPKFTTSGKVKVSFKVAPYKGTTPISKLNGVSYSVTLHGVNVSRSYTIVSKSRNINGSYSFEANVASGTYYLAITTYLDNKPSSYGNYQMFYSNVAVQVSKESTPKPKQPTPVNPSPSKPGGTTKPPVTKPPSTSKPPTVTDPCASVNASKGNAPSGASVSTYPGYAITRCMKGSYVKAIQQKLGISADGIFGPATETAVKNFQKKNGFSQSGKVDSATWTKLFPAATPPPPPPPPTDYTKYPGWNLTGGSVGGYVKAMQKRLIERGYSISGGADGVFGVNTLAALNKFQENFGFPVVNYIDATQWQKLFSNDSPPAYKDGTKIKVVVKDSSGSVITEEYLTTTLESEMTNYKVTVPKGETYTVSYTLIRGIGTKGGLMEKGGGMAVSNGKIEADTEAYCVKPDGKTYPESERPERNATLGSPTFTVTVPVVGYNQTFSGDGGYIDFQYTNETEETVEFTLTGVLNRDKETDQVEINMGEIVIAQPDEMEYQTIPNAISGEVANIQVIEQVPHWTGGCDEYNLNNFMYVHLYDGYGNVLETKEFNGSGVYWFEFTDLAPQPNPNYKVVIETVQGGGYDYMHPPEIVAYNPYSFHIDMFEVYEQFKAIPDPFNSVLEFYINDELMGTYDPIEIGSYLDLIYDIAKGCNKYKWVLRQIDDRAIWPWDRAKVDWVELTNWICDDIMVTPYCVRGGGDKCIEALIQCLLPVIPPVEPEPDPEPDPDPEIPDPEIPEPEIPEPPLDPEPIVCKIGKKIWVFT